MEFNSNPFRYGSAFGLNDIVGRKEEIAHVENTIRDGARLFLIGRRGFGKTSILRSARESMSRKGAIVLYVDAEACPDIGKLVGEIVAGALSQLGDGTDHGILKAGQFFSRLKPTLRFPADGKGVSVSIGIDLSAGKYRQMEVLAETLDSLDRLAGAQPAPRPVALIIDEFSALMARFGVTAEAQIRSVVQRHQHVEYVFAGSNVRLVMDMTTQYRRPFYNGGAKCIVGPLLAAEFAAWLHEQFLKSGYEVDGNEPVLRILSLAEEVPYNVQLLAHNCWDELQSQSRTKRAKLTVALVESALERTVQSLDPLFKQSWNRLTPLQQKTLIAVLRGNGQRLKPAEIAPSIDSPASSVRSTLRALYNRNILWNDWSQRGVRVRVEDPFFAHWVRVTAPML